MSLTKRDQDGQQQAKLKKTLQKCEALLRENRRLTVRSIAEQVNIDRKTVRKILTEDLDMRKVCAKGSQRSSPKNKSKEESLATKLGTPCLFTGSSPPVTFFCSRR